MRTTKALALLAEQERKFDRERAAWRDERERLLDRIMQLADKPMYDPYTPPAPPEEQDVFDADSALGEDLYLPPEFVSHSGPPPAPISPRERMLREPD